MFLCVAVCVCVPVTVWVTIRSLMLQLACYSSWSPSTPPLTLCGEQTLVSAPFIYEDICTLRLTEKSFIILDEFNEYCSTCYSGWMSDVCSLLWYFSRLFRNNIVDRTSFKKDKRFEIWWTSRQCAGNVLIRESLFSV